MNEEINALISHNFFTALKVSLPFLGALLLSGLLVGLLQAATQVNEAATPFIVKLFSLALVCFLAGGWAVNSFSDTIKANILSISAHPKVSTTSAPPKKSSGTSPPSNKP